MRILNVTQSYAPFFEFGGPPAKVCALAEGLARMGHDVTVLTADWGLERRLRELPGEPLATVTPFGRTWEANGVKAIYLANWFHYRAASWNPTLGRYLRARLQSFDLVHIFGLYDLLGPATAAACRERTIPYVVEPMGMFVPIVRNLWIKRRYHRFLGREMMAGASAIIATAEQEQAELMSGGIPKEIIVVRRNGVDTPKSFPARGGFRDSLKIPHSAKLILFLGRLSQKKSPDLLLRAFASEKVSELLARTPVHLAFVGPDETRMLAKLKQMAASFSVADRVHFSGPLAGDAKWGAYRDADVFVLPSQNENFGNAAAEAVASGTPVIVTDRCGIAPLLEDIAGLVVRHNERDLAAALCELLCNEALYGKLHQGCTAVYARLGWEQPLQEMATLYGKLAHRAQS